MSPHLCIGNGAALSGSDVPAQGTCTLVRILEDETLVVRIDDVEVPVVLEGAVVLQPHRPEYIAFMHRLMQADHALRCETVARDSGGRPRMRLWFHGWHDKSGDVWLDLAGMLIRQGFARVTESLYRDEYLAFEREAREKRRGVWESESPREEGE